MSGSLSPNIPAAWRKAWTDRPTGGRGMVLLATAAGLLSTASLSTVATAATAPAAAPAYGRVPLFFEANRGQTDDAVLFLARASDHAVYLTAHATVFALAQEAEGGDLPSWRRWRDSAGGAQGRLVELSFPGSAPEPSVTGLEPTAARINYLTGSDSTKWQRSVPTFSRVRYAALYPGVDLVYYGNDRQLEFDFEVAPGANPGAITMRFTGTSGLEIDGQGDLILHTGATQLRQHRPLAYQIIHGRRHEVPARYQRLDQETIAFALGRHDRGQPLVIDPVLSYSTYLGGNRGDVGWAIAADAGGSAYVAGDTLSIFKKLPMSGFQTNFGGGTRFGGDAFVAKIDPTGTNFVYLTYLGGSGLDGAVGLAIDGSGSAYVTGYTDSTNFPVAGSSGVLQAAIGGTNDPVFKVHPADAFVAKLDASGSNLVYSTYLGGEQNDTGIDIAVDPSGAAYVVGYTDSALTYWVTNQIGTALCTNGTCGNTVFVTNQSVARLLVATQSATNSIKTNILTHTLPFVTNVVQTVVTTNLLYARQATFGFPILNPVQTNGAGLQDLFLSKLSPDGAQLVYSTYLGGAADDFGTGVGVDGAGNAVVSGWTESVDLPVTNAIQPYPGGGRDGFVAKFPASGAPLVYSTYLGGGLADAAYRVAVDAAGAAYVAGAEGSTDFPSTPGSRLKGGVFQSLDGGGTWTLASSGLTHTIVSALLADPSVAGLLYAGTPRGVYKTTDGGATWLASSTGLVVRTVSTLSFHPLDTSTLFAGTSGGLFRSSDSGGTWTNLTVGLGSASVRALLFEPGNPTTLYAGTATGVFKSIDDSTNWFVINKGLGNHTVNALAAHPLAPALLYAATAGGIYRTTNAGTNWKSSSSGLSPHRSQAIAIDPTNPQLLYAGTSRGFFKSVNAATNWTLITNGLGRPHINAILVDPAMPSTVYLGTTNGLFKSIDSGASWLASQTNLDSPDVTMLSSSAATPFYAATRGTNFAGGTNDAFLVKLLPDGSAFAYAVTFGGTRNDEAWDVAVDTAGNAFVTGSTMSRNFPVAGSSIHEQTNNAGKADIFVTEFDPTGASNLFSIYLGGKKHDIAHAIAIDGAGGIYLTGQTGSSHFASTNALQPVFGAGRWDAFVLKLVSDAPSLTVARAGGTLTLRWRVCASEYIVESSEDYAGHWTPLPEKPILQNGQNTVILSDPAYSSRFFRLRCR